MALVLGAVAGGAGVQKIEATLFVGLPRVAEKGTRVQAAGDASVTPFSGTRRSGGQAAPL